MPAISFEFFPPKTDEQRAQLDQAAQALRAWQPEYASVTFGAGGSTLSYTGDTVAHLHAAHGYTVAPHLSCMGGTRAEIRALLDGYKAAGYRRIVALRGDLPSGMASAGDFRYAAELVRFIREHTGDHFHIEVAAYPETHPQADDALADLRHFKAKVDAGANGAITQYFFNPDAYFRFVEDAHRLGVCVPIVPGVMPIANFTQLKRFSDGCGAEIPRWIAKRMQAHGDDAASVRALGAEVVAQLCRRLLDGGAPALHFYTLNRARATRAVLEQLG
ncbi:methylenetetrahydrofolate reductase [NAD(P)H] [Rhodanobacter sp. DHG33]|uniref:methylenetetrahydrofolate reductase [NAD(P)H] n=1 Tax=Rhodanobacter sp. DHG33 TaxID=2775921 RepID=UPI00178243E2|nr:methylenetetrahydrofolate reductase [NAD(P)H] [Rhodanobacter sp. DHG33]MBD8897573.1 methylenetetrahydrofolate reductase [NAD(P)H] [Rhodanobacter sp. DHG33]